MSCSTANSAFDQGSAPNPASPNSTTDSPPAPNNDFSAIKRAVEASPTARSHVTIRVLLNSKGAGIIIGRAGETVGNLRSYSGARAGVSKAVDGVNDRILTVSGTIDCVATAFAFIASTLIASPPMSTHPPLGPNRTLLRILIPDPIVGALIGRGGSRIRAIQELHGVHLVACKDTLPRSNERTAELTGSAPAISAAVRDIAQCFANEWDRVQGNTDYYDPRIRLDYINSRSNNNNNNNNDDDSGAFNSDVNNPLPRPNSEHSSHVPRSRHNPGSSSRVSTRHGSGRGPSNPSSRSSYRNSNNNNRDYNRFSSSSSAAANPEHSNNSDFAPPPGINVEKVVSPSSDNTPTSEQHQSSIPSASWSGVDPENDDSVVNPSSSSSSSSSNSSKIVRQTFPIPFDTVGSIIGQGGSRINEIRETTGSRISISDVLTNKNERVVTFIGTHEQNSVALNLLYHRIGEEKRLRSMQDQLRLHQPQASNVSEQERRSVSPSQNVRV